MAHNRTSSRGSHPGHSSPYPQDLSVLSSGASGSSSPPPHPLKPTVLPPLQSLHTPSILHQSTAGSPSGADISARGAKSAAESLAFLKTESSPSGTLYEGGAAERTGSRAAVASASTPTARASPVTDTLEERARKAEAAALKKSQRPSWSCTECTRRKIKCDKIVPGCNQCQRRNKVHLCRLEVKEVPGFPLIDPSLLGQGGSGGGGNSGGSGGGGPNHGSGEGSSNYGSNNGGTQGATYQQHQQPRLATATEYDAICQSVAQLRQRLFHLESVIAKFVPVSSGDPSTTLYAYHVGGNGPEEDVGPVGREEADGRRLHNLGDEFSGQISRNRDSYDLPNAAIERIREEQGQLAESDGEVEAAVTLEFLALGRDRKQDHFSRSELRRPNEPDDLAPPASPQRLLGSTSQGVANEANTYIHDNGRGGASVGIDPNLEQYRQQYHQQLQNYGHIPSSSLGHPNSAMSLSNDIHSTDSVGTNLPDRIKSEAVVAYSLNRVGWQHGAVHIGTFQGECLEFFGWGDNRANMVNQAWLALYFAILCVGVKHMTLADALECGISPEDSKILPQQWFQAAVDALHRGNFLAKHSIYSVQAIVILVVACQDVGGSDLIATLLACGIRIAQHLAIHRFVSDADWESKRRHQNVDPYSEAGVKSLIDREIRKRLWCALATEDWVSIPYRRSYAIFPSHFTTPPPINCHDEDLSSGRMIARHADEPTIVSKCILSYRVASCVRRFFEDINSGGGLSYDLCLQIDKDIRDIIKRGPSFLRADSNISHLPPWVAWFQHYWIMSVSHKLLVIHRVFLGRSFRDPRYSYSREAAIEASRTIIQELRRGSQLPYQHIWTIPYHTIVAATTLTLDIFQCSSSDSSDDVINKRSEVQCALQELQMLSHASPIAARGVQLLSTLLAEEAKYRRSTSYKDQDGNISTMGRKRKASDNIGGGSTIVDERFGDVAKRMVTSSVGSSSMPPSPHLSTTGNHLHSLNSSNSAAAASGYPYYLAHHGSPAGSHLSDGSLTQDAFEQILINGLGAQLYPTNGSPGAVDTNVEFWRMLDASFEPVVDHNQHQSEGRIGVGSSIGEIGMNPGPSPWG